MIFFPAIDLKDGACVRLKLGDMEQATVFNDNPVAQAKIFRQKGADWLHIVDLNGAFAGKAVNGESIKAIRASIPDLKIQLGGGIRDHGSIEAWLDYGINRVILGTVALKNPDLVKQACRAFPNQIAVGIDAKAGKIAVEGWAQTSDISVLDLAKQFEDCGVSALIYTDIDRDGMMGGPNIEATKALSAKVDIPVIASGGVSSIEDVKRLKAISGLAGIISGRALYDNQLDLTLAIQICNE